MTTSPPHQEGPEARAEEGTPKPAGPVRPVLLVVLLCLADLMVVLDVTIVNVALPSMKRDLGLSQTDLQWVVNAYALIFGCFLLLAGRLGDIFGRRRLFLAGVVLFGAASMLSGLADDAATLIVGRGLQGLGGAVIAPTGLSIINTEFRHDTAGRTKAVAAWGTIAAGGSALGLLLGGVLTTTISWHWIFFINVPVAAAVLLCARAVPESRDETSDRTVDYAGALTVTAGLLLLVLALGHGASWGWTSGRTLGTLAAAVLLLAAFLVISSRVRRPLVRLGIFRIRSLAVADGVLLLLSSGIFTMFFFSTLYLQDVLGYTPIKAGLTFLPAAIGVMIGATIAQPVVGRLGPVTVGSAGLLLAGGGMLYLSRLPEGGDYATDLLPGLLLQAIGLGLAFVPVTLLATSGVPESDAGLASGLYQTVQEIGGAIGLAAMSALAVWRTGQEMTGSGAGPDVSAQVAGFRLAFLAGSLVMVAGAVLFAALLRKRHVDPVMADVAANGPAV
ncbi:MFS transporter [Streptomyces sp. NPDC047968]|uniref:MFS transporter n=1 Tax=unclassified Streptomyces TaxID=2593676 RepID=UPI00342243D0